MATGEQLTPEHGVKPTDSIESVIVEGAKRRNVCHSKWLISRFVADLRSGVEISQTVREFFAGALEHAVSDPKSAGAALGLVPPKARPKKDDSTLDIRVGKYLEAKIKGGMPLRPSKRNLVGAFTSAAERFETSESSVERAWKRYRERRASLEESWNKLVAQGTIKENVTRGNVKK